MGITIDIRGEKNVHLFSGEKKKVHPFWGDCYIDIEIKKKRTKYIKVE